MIEAIIFYMLAGIIVLSAAAVIFAKNPVHSVLWLILAFFNASGLFLMMGAEFLAMILLIVYVGAVAVLFLFVVMMLDIDFAELRAGFAKYMPLGLMLAGVVLAELVIAVTAWQVGSGAEAMIAAPMPETGISNTEALGAVLYTKYIYVFQAAGMILLTAMIGAIVLTHRQRKGVRKQNIGKQVRTRIEDSYEVVDVPVGQGVKLK